MTRRVGVQLILLLCLILILGCKSKPDDPTLAQIPEVVPAAPASSGALKIVIDRTGVYRLAADLLKQAGMESTALLGDNLSLSSGGRPVPYWFDPIGQALYFYGLQSTDRYAAHATYVLAWGQGGGTVMAQAELPAAVGEPLSPISHTIQLEENHEYISRAAVAVAEPWFWHRFSPGSSQEFTLEISVAPADGGGLLRAGVWGATTASQVDPDHRLVFTLNGRLVGTVDWDGETVFTGELVVPAGLLQVGENQLRIEAPGDTGNEIDLSHLDWLELTYPVPGALVNDYLTLQNVSGDVELPGMVLLFDVTEPDSPVFVSNASTGGYVDGLRMLVALGEHGGLQPLQLVPMTQSDWAVASHQADYMIIAPGRLLPALQPLAQARREQGLSVELVPLEELVDEFSAGVLAPAAINNFLRVAFENWSSPQPRYLLLVGEATYDYRNYLDLMPEWVVPPALVAVSYGGETISDTRLADVDGDQLPDLAVGRWPVNDVGMVTDLVERTLAYEAAGQATPRAIFVADSSEPSFAQMSDRLLNEVGLNAAAEQLYGASGQETIEAWNQGAWLINYVGHGSLNLWGRSEMLSRQVLANLQTTDHPPIVTQFTCLTGFFAHPQQSSLAEEMLWADNGPVAIVAATSLTLASNQETFAGLLLEALADPEVRTVGDALLRAQQSPEMNYGGAQEIIDTFNLLGDPALVIARPG